jgi:DNA-binding transcriptional MerR regulator
MSIAPETKNYTITETAKISGLRESTLRYYETIGLIQPIPRDKNTKRRVYSEDDVNLVVAVACLNATGFSIQDMRAYLDNRELGDAGANAQINLLSGQLKHLEYEMHYAQLRIEYVKSKVDFWQSIVQKDSKAVEASRKKTYAIADEMKLPKSPTREK